MDQESKADDYGVCGAGRSCRALQDPKGPTQFPGWPDMFHFTSVVYRPSPNSVLQCEVSKVEDFRQPQLIGFVIQSLGLYVPGCLGHKPGCQEVPGVH